MAWQETKPLRNFLSDVRCTSPAWSEKQLQIFELASQFAQGQLRKQRSDNIIAPSWQKALY